MTPFTNWDEVPLSPGIKDVARVLNMGVSTIHDRLKRGTMRPAPIPKVGRTEPWRWSKAVLIKHLDEGGYTRTGRR